MAISTRRTTSLRQKFMLPARQKKQLSDWRQNIIPHFQTYLQEPGKATWTPREYRGYADEGYSKNVIAHRSVALIAGSLSTVPWYLSQETPQGRVELRAHPLLKLLGAPNPQASGVQLMEGLVSHRLISGNAYLLKLAPEGGNPRELHLLRPDRVAVIAGADGIATGYEYTVNGKMRRYLIDRISGQSAVLHLKQFHPLDDYYGLSPMAAASYSIDQHNEAAKWNKALLQNGAKPSGALVVKMADDGSGGVLTEEQFARIKSQVDDQYMGAANAGRPMLLEGGMDWKEMSLSPRDMDFIESRHSAARDIALAFGVPPQLLGIPGDNTYSNMVEARLALWEQTILPLLDGIVASLNQWLVPHFGAGLTLSYDEEQISALAPRREKVWARIGSADFLTPEEKRRLAGVDKAR
jgi:HK97 family phage portal protein